MEWTKNENKAREIMPSYEAEIGAFKLKVRGRGSKHAWWYVTGTNFTDSGTAESLERAKELAEAAAREAAGEGNDERRP